MSVLDDRPFEPTVDEQPRPLDADPPRLMDGEPLGIQDEPAIQDRNWQLLERYLDKSFLNELRRFAFRLTKNYADADDLVSEALLKTAGAFHTLQRSTPATVTGFLRTTIRNLAIDLSRHKKRQAKYFPPALSPTCPDAPEDPDAFPIQDLEPQLSTYFDAEDRRLLAALAAIPNASRHVAVLRFLFGYEVGEIAQKLGIQKRTVTTHMGKARKIFKQQFPREGDNHGAE